MKRDILYVDDERDNLIVFEAAFEDDFNVHTAASGEQALAILDHTPAPVVVADQRMPEMSGAELFEIVRRRHPLTRRILLTGYSDPDALLDAVNKGQIFYYMKKPWQRADLMSILIRAIESHDLAAVNSSLTERLVQSERCALLGQATARVAHEMGNQLAMLPLLELIEEQYAGEEQLVQISRFARQTYERLVGLVHEVKTFIQMEGEKVEARPLSVQDTVHELVSFLRFDRTVPNDRVTVQVKADPLVSGNRVKLQQVLVNLIKNAAYAIRDRPDGRVVLAVDSTESDALISVTDNGCGMDEATLARIWEPFFTTKGKEGTGLGLDISRRIVEGHGGEITCESLPDVGTTFQIRLPRLRALAPAAAG